MRSWDLKGLREPTIVLCHRPGKLRMKRIGVCDSNRRFNNHKRRDDLGQSSPAAGMPGSLSSRLDSHRGGVGDIDPGSYKGHSVTDSMNQHLNQGRVTSKLLRKYVKML